MTLIQTIKEEYKVIEDYQTVKSDLYRGNAFVDHKPSHRNTHQRQQPSHKPRFL